MAESAEPQVEAQPRISVVVPIYKVEDYLAWCLDSLKAQTFTDFEALLVNDGSPDGSRDIAACYAEADARFRIIDKENGGLSSARNAGLAEARAPYVCFLDSDDRFTPHALETIVAAFEKHSADVVTFGAKAYPESAGYPWLNYVLSPRDAVYEAYSPDILFKEASRPFAWRTACSRDFLERTGIVFDETLRFGEDQVFHMAVYPRAAKTVFLSAKLYDYRVSRKGSLMDETLRDNERYMLEHANIVDAVLRDWERDGLLAAHMPEAAYWVCEFISYDALRLMHTKAQPVYAALHDVLAAHVDTETLLAAAPDGGVRNLLRASVDGKVPGSTAACLRLLFGFDRYRYGRKRACRRLLANILGR